jgi:hypothetical protein
MDEASKPFLLNSYKHHLGAILDFICAQRIKKDNGQIRDALNKIGNSQMDLYLGSLNIKQITKEVATELRRNNRLDQDQFKKYLSGQKGYFTVKLSDDSVWLIREGNEPGRYIHIHPGRYSPETLRVKALTLKSFIAGAILAPNLGQVDLKTVNTGRDIYLDEQPLKSLSHNSGVGGLICIGIELLTFRKEKIFAFRK